MRSDGKLFQFHLLFWILAASFFIGSCKTQRSKLSSAYEKQALDNACEEAKLISKNIADFSLSTSFRDALNEVKEKAQQDPAHEHIIGFGKGSANEIILSAVVTGSRSSGRVPEITNAFADLHNHPNNTPPSSGDLYGLLRNNLRDHRYIMRFILTADRTLYAFAITDTAAARKFLINYPPQQTPGYSPLFPDALLDEYREMQQRYGAPEEMAMAYLLEKYEVGVALLKQSTNGSFKKLRTKLLMNKGEKLFRADDCPELKTEKSSTTKAKEY